MKIDNKQVAIYIGLLFVYSTYAMTAPFYPRIAQDKGVQIWLIGVIFSINPLCNLLASLFLGKYMMAIGRKNVVISCFTFTAISMIFLSPIEEADMTQLIILSVISRISGGIGIACLFTAAMTIFISDYPGNIQIMIGRMEAAAGVGLIFGPIIGTALYLINLLIAMNVVGGLIFIYSPLAWKMLGTFREYSIKSANINRSHLISRPVIII